MRANLCVTAFVAVCFIAGYSYLYRLDSIEKELKTSRTGEEILDKSIKEMNKRITVSDELNKQEIQTSRDREEKLKAYYGLLDYQISVISDSKKQSK